MSLKPVGICKDCGEDVGRECDDGTPRCAPCRDLWLDQLCECGTSGARVMKDFPGRPLCGPCFGAAWNLKIQTDGIEAREG